MECAPQRVHRRCAGSPRPRADTTTAFDALGANNIRGAVSTDGTALWANGGGGVDPEPPDPPEPPPECGVGEGGACPAGKSNQ